MFSVSSERSRENDLTAKAEPCDSGAPKRVLTGNCGILHQKGPCLMWWFVYCWRGRRNSLGALFWVPTGSEQNIAGSLTKGFCGNLGYKPRKPISVCIWMTYIILSFLPFFPVPLHVYKHIDCSGRWKRQVFNKSLLLWLRCLLIGGRKIDDLKFWYLSSQKWPKWCFDTI